jgi:hypothetical protein
MVQNITLEEERKKDMVHHLRGGKDQDLVQGLRGGQEAGYGTGSRRRTGSRIWYRA